jgi:CubicO group peptidase (beta-lactamase class C family)
MMLFEHGLVRLTDPVAKFLPEFKKVKMWVNEDELADLTREITIQDLLRHTAGLSYGDNEDSPVDELYRQADIWSPEITSQLSLAYQPGQVWHYSVATECRSTYLTMRIRQELIFGRLSIRRLLTKN